MLGDTATVTTRHIDDMDELGYSFSYDIKASKTLNVIRVKEVNVGTEIIISLKQRAVDFFNKEYSSYTTEWYNWYHFSEPEVSMVLNDSNHLGDTLLEPRFMVPAVKRDKSGWFYCASREYTSIHWGYNVTNEDMYVFLCNGISVHGTGRNNSENRDFNSFQAESNLGITLKLPDISIVDKEGNLGLNISRSDVTHFKIEDKFGEELCKYCLAQILIKRPEDIGSRGSSDTYYYHDIIVDDKEAFTIESRTFLFHTGMDILVVGEINSGNKSRSAFSKPLTNTLVIFKEILHFQLPQELTIDGQILLNNKGISPCCQELWVKKTDCIQSYWSEDMENRAIPLGERLKFFNISNGEYYIGTSEISFPKRSPIVLSDSNPIVIRYKPELPVIEYKNLMLKVLRKYIPTEVN